MSQSTTQFPVIRLRSKGRRRAAVVLASVAILAVTVAVPAPKILLWNATASVPEGLYLLRPLAAVSRGDLVVSRLPKGAETLAAERHYLPRTVPLIKPVAALQGQTVCREGLRVTIDGREAAVALAADHLRRPLPVWTGCLRLSAGQVFLLNPAVGDSFDSRYFGPVDASKTLAQALPIYTANASPQALELPGSTLSTPKQWSFKWPR